jgi:N-acetylglucosaminyldiphosphoundecaprenol N-acetyl-beta-D-mannosaminyltransferase
MIDSKLDGRLHKVTLCGAGFNPVTCDESLDMMFEHLTPKACFWVVTSNLDHMIHNRDNPEFAQAIATSELVVADGWPLVAGLRLMGFSRAERVTGSDLLPSISERCAREGKNIFIMGGMEGWAELAASHLADEFKGLNVVGTYFPPFGFEKSAVETDKMIDAINAVKPDFLFLGVGSPKQELWISKHRSRFSCGVVIGVGMAIGFSAKAIQRAPVLMQKLGLEWFFRMCTEPKRLVKRYLADMILLPGLVLEAGSYRLQNKKKVIEP